MVGLPGFEPGSREPKSHSLDQASRQPLMFSILEPESSFFSLCIFCVSVCVQPVVSDFRISLQARGKSSSFPMQHHVLFVPVQCSTYQYSQLQPLDFVGFLSRLPFLSHFTHVTLGTFFFSYVQEESYGERSLKFLCIKCMTPPLHSWKCVHRN